ncbi:hypothetical protein [Pseudooctadecabacter sp.]|uniref:DUF7742 family protein n=1 Tax=Pseudooctadecabacter sp. TaxID=1966338 RepID=UPI0035C83F63
MRAVGLADLDMAARAVMMVPPADQPVFAERLIAQADVSDRWRKRMGRAHPGGGTGSLYAQASLGAVATSDHAGPAYCAAMSCVLVALAAWRRRTHHPL